MCGVSRYRINSYKFKTIYQYKQFIQFREKQTSTDESRVETF